jgi:hypothetical protein
MKEFRLLACPFRHDEEGSESIVVVQDLEDLGSRLRIGTVVEGKCDAGTARQTMSDPRGRRQQGE